MGSALLKGWIANGIGPIAVVEPNPSPQLRTLARSKSIALYPSVKDAPRWVRACVVALKPQVLKTEAGRLKEIAQSGALMISIAAGTNTRSMFKAWGRDARNIRAMPNTPGQIGRGISALYAAKTATAADRRLAEDLLSALGETLWVPREQMIDGVTAVSGSGPAYVFLLVECLAAAARAEGLPRDAAERLARATVSGAGALLDADKRPASDLRRDMTSPGGTTEAALNILMAKNGLEALMTRAVRAATQRAKHLGT
jgi:pyrroline-5-carboxylate reductase